MSDLRKYIQGKDYFLSGSGVTSTATSITLTSFQFPDGTNITTSDIGSLAYGTFEPETSREENFSFTTITQNADGTATLSGVTRGLKFKAPYDQDTALRQTHAGGTKVRISNSVPFYDEFANTENDETVSQTWTFTNPNYPRMDQATDAPIDDEQLATKKYVDDTAGGTPVSINRVVVAGTAGETVSAGQVVYLDETDNEWKLAYASTSTTSDNVQLGIAQGAGTNGNPITGGVLITGRDSNQSGLTQGDRVYVGDTAGAVVTSAGTVEVELGHAVSATAIDFQPKFASYTTKLQRDALVGTSGTPSTSNKYVTEADDRVEFSVTQDGSELYAASSAGSDTYAITLSPAPTAYAAGNVYRFKADVANTGACTLNVNSLGAVTIKKNVSDDLSTGDIAANQLVSVIYDGTNFQLLSAQQPKPLYAAGATSRAPGEGTGDETIAHGLGTTPRLIKITCTTGNVGVAGQNPQRGLCIGNATSTSSENSVFFAPGGTNPDFATTIIDMKSSDNVSRIVGNVTTLDATNIVINFTTFSTQTTNFNIMWEAYA